MTSRKISFCFWLLLFSCSAFAAFAQEKTDDSAQKFSCYQNKAERLKLIKEADSNPYRVRRIEFSGNRYTRDKTLRNNSILQEGDIFSQSQLMKYIRNISRIKGINPIQIGNVNISLDRPSKDVYLVFCVTEGKGK
ncbi:MAG: POTRA domain-containing protein [Pyrinomonadaceae bacterium]